MGQTVEIEWIPVEERLPEESGYYLTTIKRPSDGELIVGLYPEPIFMLAEGIEDSELCKGKKGAFIRYVEEFSYGELCGWYEEPVPVIAWAIPKPYKEVHDDQVS